MALYLVDSSGCPQGAMEEQKVFSVVLADELTMVREGVAMLCESSGYRVIGQTGDGIAALKLIQTLAPDFAVLDLNLPLLFTTEVLRRIRGLPLSTKTLVLSPRRDRKTVLEVLRAGASGYILKTGPSQQILDAFTQLRDGGMYVSPALEMGKVFIPQQEDEDPLESLSSREYQVFSLLVEGVRAKDIAIRLELSPKTVDTYRASLMRKLNIHDVASLVKFSIQRDLAFSP